ncbi:hypothetical protein R1sor_014296 [Riccia sorocarpa]|uniref:Uncharacterized protein n=1 Tax=Riccia sorocarpa TaxID=122646 RepID=A0ABD3HC09_9MARC
MADTSAQKTNTATDTSPPPIPVNDTYLNGQTNDPSVAPGSIVIVPAEERSSEEGERVQVINRHVPVDSASLQETESNRGSREISVDPTTTPQATTSNAMNGDDTDGLDNWPIEFDEKPENSSENVTVVTIGSAIRDTDSGSSPQRNGDELYCAESNLGTRATAPR